MHSTMSSASNLLTEQVKSSMQSFGRDQAAHQLLTSTVSPMAAYIQPTGTTSSFGSNLLHQISATTETVASDHLTYSGTSAAPVVAVKQLFLEESALIHALIASFSVILVSELGDKTFIITAIMAMKNSRSLVFLSSAFALFLMTVLSVGMGVAVTVIPEFYTHYASIVLFLCFGFKMLHEAYGMMTDGEKNESEFDEVQRTLDEEDAKGSKEEEEEGKDMPIEGAQQRLSSGVDNDQSNPKAPLERCEPNLWSRFIKTLYVAPIVMKVFTMIFIAEWGDRSQISTVILAAREDVVGVFIGSLSGHMFCTGLAVIGGRFVANMISIRTLTFLGGIIFLSFAVFAIFVGPD